MTASDSFQKEPGRTQGPCTIHAKLLIGCAGSVLLSLFIILSGKFVPRKSRIYLPEISWLGYWICTSAHTYLAQVFTVAPLRFL
jgi:hypothetical protein